MRGKYLIIIVFLAAVIGTLGILAGYEKPVSDADVDKYMTTTRLNAQKNADAYFAQVYREGTVNKRLGKPLQVIMQSDSSVSKDCPYGDGWASGVIEFQTGKKLEIKCQTNGSGKGVNGCMTEAEFADETYRDEEDKCQYFESLPKLH